MNDHKQSKVLDRGRCSDESVYEMLRDFVFPYFMYFMTVDVECARL